ncbi:hypothetical protein PAF17_09970 [Paracoccus sp. Z330]|uniref:SGNH/GDSL hydrolase family protein n=1 Tax=Paracoccus onchidii TaxID=3017813 RepID=A0ABT4ZFF7_9RHOB|nr:hypothetical protein [Paracoccus onchidii]MDB6177827.1 hypothetical protein [Paracoccus onchidii]
MTLIATGAAYPWLGAGLSAGGTGGAVAPDATIAFSGHSMIAAIFPNDNHAYNDGVDFPSLWQGKAHFDFIGGSSNAKRWRAKGFARTGNYDRLVLTELGDLERGLADPASPQGRHNLQYLYWFAMTAIAKGAEPVLFMPWSPRSPNLDAQALPVFHYERQWLEQHTGHKIQIIPAGIFARAAREYYDDDDALFVDLVHWRANSAMPTGLAYLTYQFFARERVRNPSLYPEMEELAWQVLQDYRWAGFGGTQDVPALTIKDPLPEPAPLPDAG